MHAYQSRLRQELRVWDNSNIDSNVKDRLISCKKRRVNFILYIYEIYHCSKSGARRRFILGYDNHCGDLLRDRRTSSSSLSYARMALM